MVKEGKKTNDEELKQNKQTEEPLNQSNEKARIQYPRTPSSPHNKVCPPIANKFSLLENLDEDNGVVTSEINVVVKDTFEVESQGSPSWKKNKVENKKESSGNGVGMEDDRFSSEMVSEESSIGEPWNDSYNMNSTEEMVEVNRREFRLAMKRERVKEREDIMRDFLGGSPSLVGEPSDAERDSFKCEQEEAINSGGREDVERNSVSAFVSEGKENSPLGLEEIRESGDIAKSLKKVGEEIEDGDCESPALVPFGNLRKVDECDKRRKEERELSRSQKKKLAKKAKGMALKVPSHD